MLRKLKNDPQHDNMTSHENIMVCMFVSSKKFRAMMLRGREEGFFPNPLTRHNPIWEDRNLNVFSRSILDQCPPPPPLFLMMKKIKKDA